MFIDLRDRERNIDWLPPICTPTGNWTQNPGKCPDQEIQPATFRCVDDPPAHWATRPGQ